MTSTAVCLSRKDEHYKIVKAELVENMLEKRKREEGQYVGNCGRFQ
jgi:hypothetical protein